ncbi:MAG: metal-dependent hydrolase [Cyanobacteria bacterium P01_D01_bin.71]
MSSLIGHGLVGGAIGWVMYRDRAPASLRRSIWLGWLIIIALIPDLDYVVPVLYPSANNGLRISHSLIFSAALPVFTLASLVISGAGRDSLWRSSIPLFFAGYSHVGMDWLVGVTPLPLLWPVSDRRFRLPFGLLPSAGKISLYNYYFYYNLGIELGVLLPLIGCALISRSRLSLQQKWAVRGLLLLVAAYFMHWAYGLSR